MEMKNYLKMKQPVAEITKQIKENSATVILEHNKSIYIKNYIHICIYQRLRLNWRSKQLSGW